MTNSQFEPHQFPSQPGNRNAVIAAILIGGACLAVCAVAGIGLAAFTLLNTGVFAEDLPAGPPAAIEEEQPDEAQNPSVTGAARLQVDETTIDLGDRQFNNVAQARFVLRNVGDEPLRILEEPQIQVIEGCCPPTPEISSMTIRPGRTATIELEFMMHEGMGGPHDFLIELRTNDPDNPITELHMLSNWVGD